MKINWKVRFKNPQFLAQILLSILIPILAYMGIALEELTTWPKLGGIVWDALSNPYVLGMVVISVYNTITDPTTRGFSDSKTALTYNRPRK